MEKKSFDGFKSVFSFSLKQLTNGIAFKAVTAIIAILLLAGMVIVNIVIADKTKENICMVEKVYILDQSGLNQTPFDQILPTIADGKYDSVEFEFTDVENKIEDVIKDAAAYGNKAVVLHMTKENLEYAMEIAIPKESVIKKSEAKQLLDKLVICFESNKIMQIGLNEEQLRVVSKPIQTSVSEVGEENKSFGEYIVELIAPMLLSMILFYMIYQYGGNTCSAIVTEKTSKLIEMLLISVKPSALIMGKVLASTCVAILQFFIWILCGVLGFVIGDRVALSVNPEYQNPLFTVFDLLKENTSHGAFSVSSIILAVLILCLGFFFYLVIAGGVGAILNKPEQVAIGTQLFAIPLTIAWMIAYFAPLSENDVLINVVRFVPFTAPFTVPADLIVGSMSLGLGILSFFLLLILTLLFVILAGRLYKGLILYNGSKLTPRKIFRIILEK